MPSNLGYLTDTSDGDPVSPSLYYRLDVSEGVPTSEGHRSSPSLYYLADTSDGIRFGSAAASLGYRTDTSNGREISPSLFGFVDTDNGERSSSSLYGRLDTSVGVRFAPVPPPPGGPVNREFSVMIVRV